MTFLEVLSVIAAAVVMFLGVTLPIPLVARWARERAVAARMRTLSSEGASESLPASGPSAEAATRDLQFAEINADSTSADAQAAFAYHQQRARDRIRQGLALNLKVALLYAVILWGCGAFSEAGRASEFLQGVVYIVGIYFLLIPALRYLYYRKQLNPLEFSVGFRIQHPFDAIAQWLLGPRREPWLLLAFVGLMTMAIIGSTGGEERRPLLAAGLTAAVLIHLFAVYRFLREGYRAQNLRLTVLRVFGQHDAADLTFGGVLHFWSHFGSFFTVVDPAFIRYRWRLLSWNTAGILFAWFVLWIVLLIAMDELGGITLKVMPQWMVFAALAVAGVFIPPVAYWLTWRSFAGNPAAIASRVGRLLARPRTLGSTFKSLSLACFNNTWPDAVGQFVRNSDVVLMDLRGWTDDNQGCANEIDFLFDHIDVGRILFLVREGADRVPLEQIISERWAWLSKDSPNGGLNDPVAIVFVAESKRLDMLGIISQLVLMADPGFPKVSPEEAQPAEGEERPLTA